MMVMVWTHATKITVVDDLFNGNHWYRDAEEDRQQDKKTERRLTRKIKVTELESNERGQWRVELDTPGRKGT